MKKFIFILIFSLGIQLISSQAVKDTLLVGYAIAPPFIIENEGSVDGINVWLWEKVSADLNINYRLIPMDFSKMLEAVQNGTIDICINPLTITSQRSRNMEFTDSFFASNSTVAIAKISSYEQLKQYLGSFFNHNFLRGLMILFLFIFLFGIITWYVEKRKNPKQFRPGWLGILDGIWWSVVTMTTVGYGDKFPISRTGKMVALIWMFIGLLFISGLTASVASSLTVDKMSGSVEGFSEFKERTVGSIKNSSSTEFLKANFFNDLRNYVDVPAGLKDLNEGQIEAFMYDEPIIKYRMKQNDEFKDLEILPIKFDLQFYAFALPKNKIELERLVSQKILEIIESYEWSVVLSEYDLIQI